MLSKEAARPATGLRALTICLACSLLLIAAQAQDTGDSCSDTPPDAEFTCAEQERLDKCDRDWMIEGNFCQETCGRCAPAPTAAPASDPALAPIVELEPLAAENTPEIPAEVVPFEEPEDEPAAAPAPIAEMPLPRPQVQTEPTPAQEEFLEALASEAGVLSSAPPAEREPTVERLPALTLAPPREEEPQQPSTATSPRAIPVDETRMNAVQSPPECNTTSAWDVLSSDPQLDITRRAVETLNLKEVLQNPEIQFTFFTPTNAAWSAAATAERRPLAQLLSSRNVLRDVIFSHIIPNSIIDADALRSTRSITPQTNIPIYVVLPQPDAQGPDNIGLISSGSNVRIVQPNKAVACNYALHTINGVLRSSPSDILGVNPAYTRAAAAAAAAAEAEAEAEAEAAGAASDGAGP